MRKNKTKITCYSSYRETNQYISNDVVVQSVDLLEEDVSSFLQYQGSNVHHISRTTDGHGSIHVMDQMRQFTLAGI